MATSTSAEAVSSRKHPNNTVGVHKIQKWPSLKPVLAFHSTSSYLRLTQMIASRLVSQSVSIRVVDDGDGSFAIKNALNTACRCPTPNQPLFLSQPTQFVSIRTFFLSA
jgi:hypothetical protein